MTNLAIADPLAIRVNDVRRQFARRGDMANAEFIYGEIAKRMFDRLKFVRLKPSTILDAGCGAGHRARTLMQRYPTAQLIGLDHCETVLGLARQATRLPWLKQIAARLRNQDPKWICADLAETTMAPESIDLVWSNLAMHWHPRPHDVLREWSRVLRPDGLAFFSCWGPATGIEIRRAIELAGLQTRTLPLVDMHDLGDIMVQHGFADPVMDQETITLTYSHPEKLLADAQALGGNPTASRKASLASRQWRQRLCDALVAQSKSKGTLTLTLEVAYGHAWRGAIRRQDGETRISLQGITRREKL